MVKEEEPITIKIFYSYAHKDKNLQEELEKHLANLKFRGIITTWSDQNINAGEVWEHKINVNLDEADIILLLISPDFMCSRYCYSIELKRALGRYDEKKSELIPIILRPVDWEDSLFHHLQALPSDAKPVTTWDNLDEAFLNIEKGIKIIVRKMLARKYTQKAIDSILEKQLEKALVYRDKASKIDNAELKTFVVKGNALYYLERYEETLDAHKQASQTGPKGAAYYANLGSILRRLTCYEEAIDAYKQASQIETHKAYYHEIIGNIIEEQLKYYDKASDAYKQASQEALDAYKQASYIEPNNANYYEAIGNVLDEHLKHYEEALDAYKKASQLKPDEAYYYEMIGSILCSPLNRYEEALATYQRACKIEPNNPYYHSIIGDTLFHLNRYEEALDAYEQASQMEPDEASHYEKQARVHEQWAQELRDKAAKLTK